MNPAGALESSQSRVLNASLFTQAAQHQKDLVFDDRLPRDPRLTETMQQAPTHEHRHGPVALGHGLIAEAHWNLSTAELYEHAIKRGEAEIAADGPLVARTGQHTGRSPNDKFIVRDDATESTVWWGKVNRPIEQSRFDAIKTRMLDHLKRRDLFVLDCFAGADPNHRLPVRVVSELAWHNLFARNLFIQAKPGELASHRPEFTIVQAPGFKADPKGDRVNSETVILVDFSQRLVLIGGTSYAGECKKSVFTIMNFLIAGEGTCLPMHCSVSVGPEDVHAGGLLRSLRHRQDHPLGRSAHRMLPRRRRARLERWTASSTSRAAATPR